MVKAAHLFSSCCLSGTETAYYLICCFGILLSGTETICRIQSAKITFQIQQMCMLPFIIQAYLLHLNRTPCLW